MGQFSDAVAAFYRDLAQHANEQRVVTMTFSEFGRRVAENANRGTDHGEASASPSGVLAGSWRALPLFG
ncbi:MAG TPA: DUF1501 domain-containing protein [Candidatus Dormibacteraeota bacterium]|nr:DUF1501 domain-containing protein [Candidatus Dormibacteraeota bacterium]